MTPELYIEKEITEGRLTVHHIAELIRYWQTGHGLTVDGLPGPKTRSSIEVAIVKRNDPTDLAVAWAWPLPKLPDGRLPQITSAFRTADRPTHNGCDMFYAYRASDGAVRSGDGGAARGRDGTIRWFIPPGTCALSVARGTVVIAGPSKTGHRVWIRHDGGLHTGYFHLHDLKISTGQAINQGTPLGLVGDNPSVYDATHLHFEVNRNPFKYEDNVLDPEPFLKKATYR